MYNKSAETRMDWILVISNDNTEPSLTRLYGTKEEMEHCIKYLMKEDINEDTIEGLVERENTFIGCVKGINNNINYLAKPFHTMEIKDLRGVCFDV